MADTVTVFDRSGRPLDELNVSVVRHLKLDHTVDMDRGSFLISTGDVKATERNLRRNNFIYVISDQPNIKPWAAIVYPDESNGLRVNANAEYEVPLRGAEWLWGTRLTGAIETITPGQTPGNTFISILQIAQRAAPFPPLLMTFGGVNVTGQPTEQTWNLQDCYSIVNTLSSDNDFYWGFVASRDWNVTTQQGTGNLVLTPYFRAKIGKRDQISLVASSGSGNSLDHANLVGSTVSERSAHTFANRVIAYGKMDDWKQNIIYTADDKISQGLYGIVEKSVSFQTATTVSALQPCAEKELKLSKNRLYVDGDLINPTANSTVPFPAIGDVCFVQPDYNGSTFLADKYGTVLRMRVKETNYNPQNNTMAVNLEGVFDDE